MNHALLHLAALAVHLADLAELDLGAARCHFNNHPQNPAVLNPALVGFVFGGGGKGGGVARRRRPALGPHLAPPPRTWRARLLTLGVCVVALIFFSHKKKHTETYRNIQKHIVYAFFYSCLHRKDNGIFFL